MAFIYQPPPVGFIWTIRPLVSVPHRPARAFIIARGPAARRVPDWDGLDRLMGHVVNQFGFLPAYEGFACDAVDFRVEAPRVIVTVMKRTQRPHQPRHVLRWRGLGCGVELGARWQRLCQLNVQQTYPSACPQMHFAGRLLPHLLRLERGEFGFKLVELVCRLRAYLAVQMIPGMSALSVVEHHSAQGALNMLPHTSPPLVGAAGRDIQRVMESNVRPRRSPMAFQ